MALPVFLARMVSHLDPGFFSGACCSDMQKTPVNIRVVSIRKRCFFIPSLCEKILSSEYQLYVCGKLFSHALIENKIPRFGMETN